MLYDALGVQWPLVPKLMQTCRVEPSTSYVRGGGPENADTCGVLGQLTLKFTQPRARPGTLLRPDISSYHLSDLMRVLNCVSGLVLDVYICLPLLNVATGVFWHLRQLLGDKTMPPRKRFFIQRCASWIELVPSFNQVQLPASNSKN